MVMLTFFSNCVTWAIGCCRAATEAAIDGELPKFLASEHREYGTPVGSAVVLGIITTLILLCYGFLATSNEDLFWDLFASSAVLFLLPYLGAVGAFWYMRRIDEARPRPFRVPGGMGFASLITVVCIVLLLMTVLLFMYVPGEGFNLQVVIVAIGSILVGEAMILLAEHENRQ
jgi:amino acid transporter